MADDGDGHEYGPEDDDHGDDCESDSGGLYEFEGDSDEYYDEDEDDDDDVHGHGHGAGPPTPAHVAAIDATVGRMLEMLMRSGEMQRISEHAAAERERRDTVEHRALLAAAARGDLGEVRRVLLSVGDGGVRDALGFSGDGEWDALARAAAAGHLGVVRYLLDAGADNIDVALDAACQNGRETVVGVLLLRAGDRVDALVLSGLIYKAASWERAGIVHLLLAAGVDCERDVLPERGSSVLARVAALGNARAMLTLVAAGVDPPEWVALHFAAAMGSAGELRRLLAGSEVDINYEAFDKYTALALAAHHGHLDAVRTLLANGAAVNSGSRLPLSVAAREGKLDVVRLLLAAGADPGGRPDDHTTPLSQAASGGSVEVVRELVRAGADGCGRSFGDWTPMFAAARDGRASVIVALHELGASVSDVREDGSTPLHMAGIRTRAEAVFALAACGADLEAVNGGGDTALESCATGISPHGFMMDQRVDNPAIDALLALGASTRRLQSSCRRPQVQLWLAGQHPLQVERAELERVLLAVGGGSFPTDLAQLCGSYVRVLEPAAGGAAAAAGADREEGVSAEGGAATGRKRRRAGR